MLSMSALRGEADIADPRSNVRQSPKADIARSWLDLDWTSTPQALVSIDGVRADPLRAAASTCCPSLADPKGYMSCTGQVLTMIIDHRQRSLAFMATRDVVVVRHCGLAAFPPRLCSPR